MKLKPLIIPILVVAMALGTAWAIRGKFGHEQGAAWAGVTLFRRTLIIPQ